MEIESLKLSGKHLERESGRWQGCGKYSERDREMEVT